MLPALGSGRIYGMLCLLVSYRFKSTLRLLKISGHQADTIVDGQWVGSKGE